MLIIGLTGSIGMGKSTAAARFRHNGIAIFDADAAVHELYRGEAVGLIEAAFPGTTGPDGVDRQKLSAALMGDPVGFKRLEAIVHPLVRDKERQFLHEENARGARMAVLEVPLLLETRGDALVDVVVVVSASTETQRRRVLDRPGMTEAKLAEILKRQMPDEEKRRRAHFVVDTNGSIAETEATIDGIVSELVRRKGTAFARHWS